MIKAHNDVNLVDLKPEMLQFILDLEYNLGKDLVITSGYRSPEHPEEIKKKSPGEHTTGLAVDIAAVGGTPVYELVYEAIQLGCKRVGIDRKRHFVHLGLDDTRVTSIWTY